MKIRLGVGDPKPIFTGARAAARNFDDARAFPERTSSIALGAAGPIQRWQTDFLFDYRIFPPAIIGFAAEWTHAGRAMVVGDVILQRAFMPPVGFGVCMEFAVRVTAIMREAQRLGFAYETLAGHAESGVSEFTFEEKDGQLRFTIHTFSQPGHWTSRLGKHWFTLPYQRWCTHRALAHVRRQFRAHNQDAASASQATHR